MDQYKAVMVDPGWYWVSIWPYCLVLGGTGSVEGGTGFYLVVLGHGAELVET